jgi:hypothetical protein
MNEQDLRDCFAMMRAITGASPQECYEFADEMLEVRNSSGSEEVGIVSIKRKYVKKEK